MPTSVAACLFLILLCPAVARAQTAADKTPPGPGASTSAGEGASVKVGGLIFADFTDTVAPTAVDAGGASYHPTSFNVTRSYINVTGHFNSVLSFRITPDIARETSATSALNGSYVFRLKYAYAQIALDKWTGRFTDTWIRVGLHPTPFVEGRDAVYRYRFQGALMPEKEGLMFSSDTGLSFHTSMPGHYGDVQISLMNGEGYSHPETNNQKSLQLRGTLHPAPAAASAVLQALRVSGFYDYNHYAAGAPKTRAIGGLAFEHARVNIGADLVHSRDQLLPTAVPADGRGWDVFVTPFFARKGHGPEALVRYDHWTPDRLKSDLRHRFVGGLSWWWTPASGVGGAVMLDYESVTVAHPSFPQPDQRRLTLHAFLAF